MWTTLLIASALGADPEGERLAESLVLAARDGEWRAVERRYQTLLESHPGGLSGPIHQTAAQGARQRGELMLAAQRLLRVRDNGEGYQRAKGDLDVLRESTGMVMLTVSPPAPLEVEAMPFTPELRQAILDASKALSENGRFVGLLPSGRYTLGSATFDVPAGFEWNVVQAFKGQTTPQ